MSDIILKVANISKQYRLGLVGTGTLSHDINRWWHRIRGKEDPYLKVGVENDRSSKTESNYVWALNDINFEVKSGEVLGIIGKNGAGKSTLLKILSQVTIPSSGIVKSKGRIASLLEVGTGFHPEMTGRENIYLNGAILGMNKAEIKRKEDEIIEFSGCQSYIDTPVKRYSSGMRVRLAFAVAAHLEPDILVIDEVLAVGDAEFQKKAIGKMQDISGGDGRTVLFVSHNMSAVKSICSRAIVLRNGKIDFEGPTNDAINFYLRDESEDSGKAIHKRTDRSGNGKMTLSSVELYNNSNEVQDYAVSGEFIRFKLNYKRNSEVKEKLILGITFMGMNEDKKATIVTDEMPVTINSLLERGYINIDIQNFYLRGGEYYLKFVLSEGTTEKINQIDNISKALRIRVLEGDIYNLGKNNRPDSSVIIPCTLS